MLSKREDTALQAKASLRDEEKAADGMPSAAAASCSDVAKALGLSASADLILDCSLV